MGVIEFEYWPYIHLKIAKGMDLNMIRGEIEDGLEENGSQQDGLGRTVFHWLSVHPDQVTAKSIVNELELKGHD